MDERQQAAAERIFELIPIWDRDETKTARQQIADIYNSISLNPMDTIDYLLDIIDNYES